MFLAVGVLAALLNARATGTGQVVDAAMTDGVAVLQALTLTLQAMGLWKDERQSNLLDGGAPRYDTYVCADGRHVALGALEPQFYARLLEGLGLADDERMRKPDDPMRWPVQRELLAAVLRSQPRDRWAAQFEGSDACLSPVLSLHEAPRHPHNRARSSFIQAAGLTQPGTAPRFSKTSVEAPPPLPSADADVRSSLSRWGWAASDIDRLLATGAAR
jgi:alpha-methylacyl-CoA racemase